MNKIIQVFRPYTFILGFLLPWFVAVNASAQNTSVEDTAFGDKRQVFRDWQGDCLEDEFCSASVFAPAGTDSDTADYIFRASREAGDLTPLFLSFLAIGHVPGNGEIINLRVIGGPAFALALGAGYSVSEDGSEFILSDQAMLNTVYPALKHASTMSVSFRDGRGEVHTAEFSLRGMSASISWMNSEQKRSNKSVKVGPPVQNATKLETNDSLNVAPLQLPPAIMALQSQVEACAGWAGRPEPENSSKRYDLGEGVNLFIVPCTPGDTNPSSRIYVAQKGGAIDAMLFARFDGANGWTGTDRLVNAGFDKDSGVLSSRVKTQGLPGCGVLGVWLWRASDFSMLRYASWEDCENARPPEDWQVIYEPTVQ
jgi:hypothetical protein